MLPFEVASHLIQQIFISRPRMKLSKTAIQKILYKVSVSLPKGDKVRSSLPYYWYNYGPYSDVVESAIDGLRMNGTLLEEETHTGKTVLMAAGTRPEGIAVLNDASEMVKNVVASCNPYRIEPLIEEIYRTYAPFPFLPHYKLDFLAPLTLYVQRAAKEQTTLIRFSSDLDTPHIDALENMLYTCEVEIPDDPLFDEFTDIFTSFVSAAGIAFDRMRHEDPDCGFLAEETQKRAEEIWYTFTRGLRILKEAHDPYYDPEISTWHILYQAKLRELNPAIREYTRSVRKSTLNKRGREPDEQSKRILSSLVNGYLS